MMETSASFEVRSAPLSHPTLGAESTVASRAAAVTDPTIASNAAELAARCRALDDAQLAVERLYARWAELEVKRG